MYLRAFLISVLTPRPQNETSILEVGQHSTEEASAFLTRPT